MAYLGTTAASSVQNPPVVMAQIMGAGPDTRIAGSTGLFLSNNYNASSTATYREGQASGGRLWQYVTTDTSTGVLNSGYFSDAGKLGMRPLDMIAILAVATTASTNSCMRMTYVTSISTAGAAVLSSGITSTS
jgi:hypothetical protein